VARWPLTRVVINCYYENQTEEAEVYVDVGRTTSEWWAERNEWNYNESMEQRKDEKLKKEREEKRKTAGD